MATTKRTSPRSTGSARTRRVLRTQPRSLAFAVGAALFPWTLLSPALAQTSATALPTGGQVAAGAASLTYSPNKLQIDQSTNKAILNWESFSIGSSAWVNFSQPSSSAIALNRVLGTNPSEIFGRLTANGQVFLTNPSGVLFARSASVDVGGLFATTLSIADKDFLNGRYNFHNAGGAQSVVNQGNIVTANGYAALAGPQVRNDGVIVARAGSVALAAGDRVSLDMVGDGLIKVSVDQAALNASAINSGRIEADGGNVLLTARSANALLDTVVNNSGVIRAHSLIERNGEIILDGGSAGVVSNSGALAVAGTDAGTTGGEVKVLGDKVGLFNGTRIDASGDAGGGTINIGGNFQGRGPLQNASQTIVARDAAIKADAITSGEGGKVVVWSNDATQFYGAISARGGSASGNGGSVEVSGKHLLNYRGTTDTRAPHGRSGMLLLDPDDLTVVHDDSVATDSNNSPGPSFVANPATTNPWQLLDSTINASLNTTDVTITTSSSGSIQIRNDSGTVVIDPGVPNIRTLTMTSAGGISWNAGWEYSNIGQLTLNAQAGSISGTGNLLVSGTSPVLLQATTGITASLNGVASLAAASSAGDVSLAVGSLSLAIDSLTNPVSFAVVNGISAGGNASVSYTGPGTLTLNQSISGTNATVVTDDLAFAGGAQIVATSKATVAPWTASTGISLGQLFDDRIKFGLNAFRVNGNIVAATLQIGNSSNTAGIQTTGNFDPDLGGGSTLNLTTAGEITNPGGGDPIGGTNIASLALLAGTGIGASGPAMRTRVNSLAASTGNGGVFIRNDAALAPTPGTVTVTTVDGVAGINGGSGSIDLREERNLTVSQAISAVGTLDVRFGQAAGPGPHTFTLAATGSLSSSASTVSGNGGTEIFDFTAAPATVATLSGGPGNDELKQSTKTWDLTGSNAGTSGGLTWTTIGTLTDTGAGVFNFTTNTAAAENINAVGGTLDYSAGRTNPVTFDLANGLNATTGITKNYSGISTVVGNANVNNQITGNAATYSLTGLDAGNSGGVSWTAFPNLNDAGAGVFQFTTNAAAVSGSVSAVGGTLDYSAGFTNAVTFDVSNGSGNTTGIGTTWSGVTVVTGNANAASQIIGAGLTYLLANATPDAGTNGTVNWTNFRNVNDATGTVDFQASGSVTGSVTAQTLNYSTYGSSVTVDLTAGTATGIGTTWSGVSTINANAVQSNIIGGTGETYTLANGTLDAGSNGTVSWTAFRNINDAAGAVNFQASGSVSGNVTADTLNFTTYGSGVTLDVTAQTVTGVGGTANANTVNANAGQTNTVGGTAAPYLLTDAIPDAGSSSGYTWTNFQNISDATGTVNFQVSGSVTGNVTAQTLNYSTYGQALSFDITAGSITNDGVGGTLSGFSTVNANPAQNNTVGGSGETYLLTDATPNAGSGNGYTWSAFRNINDATGAVNFQASGSVSGNVTADTLNFTTSGSGVTLDVTAQTVTGVGGTAIANTVNANSGQSNTVSGTAATYLLTDATPDAGSSSGYTWANFQNINDAAGTVNFQASGSVSGSIIAQTLNYAGYATAVTFDVSNGLGNTTGIGATWSAVSTVTGNANAGSTIIGGAATYTVNGADSGSSGSVSWSAFPNLADAGGGIFNMTTGTLSGSIDGGTGSALQGAAITDVILTGSAANGYSGSTAAVAAGFSNIRTLTGSGAGTLTGENATSTWSLGASKTYDDSAGNGTLTFSGFGTAQGGGQADTFNVTAPTALSLKGGGGNDVFDVAAVTLTGSIDGETGTNKLQGAGITDATLAGSATDGYSGTTANVTGGFSNIRTLTGSGAGTLTGENAISTWSLGASKTYDDSAGNGTLTFSGFGTAQGGTQADTFNVTAVTTLNLRGGGGNDIFDVGAALAGTIDGEAGSDTLRGTQITSVTLTGSAANGYAGTNAGVSGGFADIDILTGTGAGTLTGESAISTWSLGASKTYDDGAGNGTLTFSGFATAQGGSQPDTFNVTTATTLAINAGAGVDVFNLNAQLSGSIDGEANGATLQGTQVTNATLTAQGAIGGFNGTTDGVALTGTFSNVTAINATGGGTLSGINATATWSVTSADSGTYTSTNALAFANFANLTGNAGNDSFVLANGATVSGIVNGAAGINGIDWSAYTTPRTVTLAATGGVGFNGTEASIAGGFQNISGLIGSGAGGDTLNGLNAAATWNVDAANAGTYTSTNIANFAGFENLNGGTNNDAFQLGATGSVSGTMNGGGGTNSLTGNNVASAWTINTLNGGSVTDSNGTSAFANMQNLTGGSSTDTFTLTAAGRISGTIDGASGTNTLTGNNLASTWAINANNAGTLTDANGANVFVNVQNVAGGSSTDSFTLSGTGHESAIDGGGGANTLTGNNIATVWSISGPNSGTLTDANGAKAFSNIQNVNGGTAADTFTGAGGSLGGSLTDGGSPTTLNSTITTAGSQTYAGAVTLGSSSALVAGAGNISFGSTINGGTNSLTTNNTGALALGTGISNMVNLTIQGGPSSGVTFPTTSLTGDLNVTSGGNVGQTGTLTVNGTTCICASGSITLINAGNDFGGAVSLTGGTTQITDMNVLTLGVLNTGALTTINTGALNLGSGTISGALSATSNGGSVSQSGPLTVAGTAAINAGVGTITFASANDFQGAVSLTGSTTQITDANALTLGAVNTGALTANSSGAMNLGSGTIAGALSATSNGGAISESGPLNVSGATNLQAGGGAIALNASNTFTGAVTAGGGSISMTAANTLTPATITAGAGAVMLIANGFATTGLIQGGSATLNSATQVGGGTTLNINFGFGSVVLAGSASAWNLSGPSAPQPTITPTGQNTGANVFYNTGCISGPACAGVFSVTASIGSSVSQIAAQALKDAQSTDSVAKQIDYGFAGDVGTTPPMDHRIDETGISTPDCFEESRENQPCK